MATKLETIEHDVGDVSKRLGLMAPTFPSVNARSTVQNSAAQSSRLADIYRDNGINSSMTDQVFAIYKLDFELFDYDYGSVVKRVHSH